MGRQFRKILKQAELGPFKLYDLRHSYASHLLHEGVNVTDVAAVLGHASPTTTMQFYAHPNEDRGYIADKLTAARKAKR